MKPLLNLSFLLPFFLALFIPGNLICQDEALNDSTDVVADSLLVELIFEYGSKGFDYLTYDVNLDSAEFYLKKALDLQYSTNNYEIDERVVTNHINLASVYRRIHKTDEALYQLSEAERILKRVDPDNLLFSNIYHNKGNLYKAKNDLYRTKEYYAYALDFVRRIGQDTTMNFSHILSNYLDLLFELGEVDQAEDLLASIDISSLNINPLIELKLLLVNANSYARLNKNDLALEYYDKALAIVENNPNSDFINLRINYYCDKIDFLLLNGDYQQSLDECDKAFAFIETLEPSSTKNKLNIHSLIAYRSATVQNIIGNQERALKLVDNEITNLNEYLNQLALTSESASLNSRNSSILPDLYILKSRIHLEQSKKSLTLENLKLAYNAYVKAIETLNNVKLAMQNEESKVFATSQIIEVYDEAIYVGKLLYDITGDLQYLENSFENAESSKSFALYSEIKNVEAMEFSDLPPELKSKENRILGEIQYLKQMLYDERQKPNSDSSLIRDYEDKIFQLSDDYDDLVREIEHNNSKYYELKYKSKFVSLEEVQDKLAYKEALIEYVLSDTLLITYVVDRKGINVLSQVIGPEFSDECLEYYQLLYKQNFSSGVHENYKRFVELGRKFYSILIEPCLEYTEKKSLTIIPDGAIMYLPFETFLTKATDSEYINYMDLPYMIRKYSVGYSHSSTLKFEERLKTRSPQRKVLAFAPEYLDPLKGNILTADNLRQVMPDTEILMPLRGIIKEVQSINEIVPSRIFLNEEATEARFKKLAPDYNVLHLAMHTIMRDDEPLNSHLAFTNAVTDSVEDNKLYAYEIYNLKLNAQMAVLSSCSSGFGKMQKGEGMMSLARGFIYAGCPSIIMTLWPVSDQSSSELMSSFYKYLKKGKSKQESMRLSKMDYLDSADDLTSNPYFWSGFVVVGDSSPIYRKSGLAYWMILVVLFIGVIVFIQYRRS